MVHAQCIKTKKIYDWVILTGSDELEIFIPDNIHPHIQKARKKKIDIPVTCKTPPLDAISNKAQKHVTCEISRIQNTNKKEMKIVTLIQSIPILIDLHIGKKKICSFHKIVHLKEEVLLCLPHPLDEEHIVCKPINITCDIHQNLSHHHILVDVTVCKHVSVEKEVKLELKGKPCTPRIGVSIPLFSKVLPPPPLPKKVIFLEKKLPFQITMIELDADGIKKLDEKIKKRKNDRSLKNNQ